MFFPIGFFIGLKKLWVKHMYKVKLNKKRHQIASKDALKKHNTINKCCHFKIAFFQVFWIAGKSTIV